MKVRAAFLVEWAQTNTVATAAKEAGGPVVKRSRYQDVTP